MLKRPASEPSLAPPWLYGLECSSFVLRPSVCLLSIARKLFSLPRVLENTPSRIPERAHDCAISERALSLLSSPYASLSLSSFFSLLHFCGDLGRTDWRAGDRPIGAHPQNPRFPHWPPPYNPPLLLVRAAALRSLRRLFEGLLLRPGGVA